MESVALSRTHDPITAKIAAESVDVTFLEDRVVESLSDKPMTTHEISEITGIQLVSISPRIRPLVKKGFVTDSGERRLGESGRRSIVWKLVDTLGRAA